jgi:hypothetical protein
MAVRKAPPAPPTKPPSLPPGRAVELLAQQREGARGLLAKPQLTQLELDEWEQTTRAIITGAFGDPSEAVERLRIASPNYPFRVGQGERFLAQFRHDELEAKASTVSSCISQLQMGLVEPAAEQGAKASWGHPYETARKVLKMLHGIFLTYGHQSWHISPRGGEGDHFDSLGLDEDAARKALRILATKNLVKHAGQDDFVITDYGIRACEHQNVLDQELPVSEPGRGAGVLEVVATADLGELDRIDEIVESDEIRQIVVRDIAELRSAIRARLSKSTLLLGGSILEGVLIDILDRNRALAATYLKRRRFPEDASLQDLIAIAGDPALLDAPRFLLTPTSAALAQAVTDHRDLIHPHAEARGHIRVDGTTAQAVVHLLSLVVRDLAEAKARGDIEAYVNK